MKALCRVRADAAKAASARTRQRAFFLGRRPLHTFSLYIDIVARFFAVAGRCMTFFLRNFCEIFGGGDADIARVLMQKTGADLPPPFLYVALTLLPLREPKRSWLPPSRPLPF